MDTYLFFGSFNPIHNGHLALVEYILKNTNADVWIIVSPQNPHKDPRELIPFTDRYNMVRLATEHLAGRVRVLDIEESMTKPSYTINTIQKLYELYPGRKFFLLAGSDIVDTIHTWFRYEDITSLVDIKFYPRMERDRKKCSPELMDAPVMECSSTEFRNHRNYDILPEKVKEYIIGKGLYL